MENKLKTTVYSCSGCSNVAQLANKIAVKLDRDHLAKMSCIAGVGGDVSSLVKIAITADEILVLDGCKLACALNCLKRHGILPKTHIVLTDHDLTKNLHSDFTEEEFIPIYNEIQKHIKN